MWYIVYSVSLEVVAMAADGDVVAFRGAGGRRPQLPDEVASYVREQIMSGRFRPGDFLRMEPIAEAVGVSNTPVREGLLALRSEGFVRLVPRRGFVVAEFSRQDIRDLFWTQATLAGELAARAAQRITPAELDRLTAINEQLEQAIEAGDADRIGTLGHAFHRQINLTADSHRLALLLAGVVKHLPNRYYASIEARVESARQQHPTLLDLLRTHQARKARTAMTEHIMQSAEFVIELLEQHGLWSGDTADRRAT